MKESGPIAGVEHYLENISQQLMRAKETLAVAESVTAGMLQTAFASARDASVFFHGGLTAYNLRQKHRHLGIDLASGLQCNCVSEEIAAQMAMAVSVSFESQWGIGITGYAAPLPEQKEDELYAHVAFAYRHSLLHQETLTGRGTVAYTVQQHYVAQLVKRFAQLVERQYEPFAA